MKYFFILLLSTCSLALNAKDELKYYRYTSDIMGYLKIDQWIDYVKRIKTDDQIPKYYGYPALDDKTKSYFKKFDIIGYESGLKKQLVKNISLEELTNAHQKLKNPFTSKMINILLNKKKNSLNFQRRVVLAKDIKISDERKPLVESVYNLLSYNALADHMFKTIAAQEKLDGKLNKVLQADNKDAPNEQNKNGMNTKMPEVKHVFLAQIHMALEKTGLNEIRQFVQMLKDKNVQKVVSLYNNYDYFYLYKYDRMIYLQQEQDIKKGIKRSSSLLN